MTNSVVVRLAQGIGFMVLEASLKLDRLTSRIAFDSEFLYARDRGEGNGKSLVLGLEKCSQSLGRVMNYAHQ